MTELVPLPAASVGSIPAAPPPGLLRPPVVSFDPETGEARPFVPPERNGRADSAMPSLPNSRDVDRSFRTQEHTWLGTDGTEWPLTRPETGVFIVQEGVEGLHLPLTDEIVRESPSLAGGSFHGYRVKPRQVVWPLYIYTDESSEAFYDLDRRIFKSMRIGKYGTWRVTLPDGSFRELKMRLQPVSTSFDRDPGRFGWQKYILQFVADEEPFWTTEGPTAGAETTFVDEGGLPFFGPAGNNGPPLNISPASAETRREIFNDGDEPVYPRVEVRGPMDSVDFTIGDRSYTLQCDLENDGWIMVDTDPRTFSIRDHTGANRIHSISDWIFEPMPEQESTEVSVAPQGFGGGAVVVHAPPLYHRAW